MRINLDNSNFAESIRSANLIIPRAEYDPNAAEGADKKPEKRTDKVSGLVEYRHDIHVTVIDLGAPFAQQENFTVRVWADKLIEELPGGVLSCPVAFGGLALNLMERRSGDGKGFTASLSAESWTFEPRPSSRRVSRSEGNGAPDPVPTG